MVFGKDNLLPFKKLLKHPEIGCVYKCAAIPFVGLPGANVDQWIFFVEVNQQEKVAFICISGG
jgi:hypothetical protein